MAEYTPEQTNEIENPWTGNFVKGSFTSALKHLWDVWSSDKYHVHLGIWGRFSFGTYM